MLLLRQPISRTANKFSITKQPIRNFRVSTANMTIKAYFNCSWEGPEVDVDQKGDVTKTGAVKRE